MNYCAIAYTIYEFDYRVRRYAEALVRKGNRIDAYALNRSGTPGEASGLNGVNVVHVQERAYEEKRPIQFFKKVALFFLRTFFRLASGSARSRYHLVHVHNVPDFLVFTALIPKLLGARIILDIHDILPEFYCQKFGVAPNSMVFRLLRLVEWCSVRFADYVIVANDVWREKLIARNNLSPDRCIALLNYPNMAFFKNVKNIQRLDEFNIIYPGTLSHLHGIDIAIRAVGIARREIPYVKMRIYSNSGPATYREMLIRLVAEMKLEDAVQFCPALRIDDIASIYDNIHAGIVPKRAGIFSSEAFSTKVFDYMAAGVPIIASRTTVDTWYFDDSLICYFTPDDEEDCARAIAEFAKNPERRAKLAESGKRYVEKNNWEVKKTAYLGIADSLLKKRFQ